MQHLKGRGLLEYVGATSQTVYVHDLSRDFAELECKGKLNESADLEKRRWVYYENAYSAELKMTPSHRCWQKLIRIGIAFNYWARNIRIFQGFEWTNFSNVVELTLRGLKELRGDLNLKGVKCLRSSELVDISARDTLDGLQDLNNLTYFRWKVYNNHLDSNRTRMMGQLPASTKILLLDARVLLRREVFARCTNLSRVELTMCRALETLDLSNCASLQRITFERVICLETVSGLSIDGLQDLNNLTCFKLETGVLFKGNKRVMIGKLPASLKALYLSEDCSMPEYMAKRTILMRPDMFARCTNLSMVALESCSAENLDFSNCTSLQSVKLLQCRAENVNFSNCTSLQSVMLESVVDLVGIPGIGDLAYNIYI